MFRIVIALIGAAALVIPGPGRGQGDGPTTEETLGWINEKFEGIGSVHWYDYKKRWYDKEDPFWYKSRGSKWDEVSHVGFSDRGEFYISSPTKERVEGLNDFDRGDVDWYENTYRDYFHMKDVEIKIEEPADETARYEDEVKKGTTSFNHPDGVVEIRFICLEEGVSCMRSKSSGPFTTSSTLVVLPHRSMGERMLKAFRHLQSLAEDKPKELF